MKFKIIIDKDCEEEIVAKVHSASDLTRNIENLVVSYKLINRDTTSSSCGIFIYHLTRVVKCALYLCTVFN